ncbi:uroporphyrinogen-III C-methyltransferase [Brachybacterium sp. GCM10030267]|uniref:uroporphyrinogen-III C-methyltransferase n=1 Tax=Brachybacterium sp. GCM10030267 TaxID=3273381 RepID=UPI00361D02A9
MRDLPSTVLDPGSVALVGGGPGALDLITVRALDLLRQADVVVVDRLGPVGLTELLEDDVEIVDVGKIPGGRSTSQQAINDLLVQHARAGRRVVRLKGGDPFVLGRGGEEVLACRAAGVPVQVVPGVSAAVAGPAAGDVPVTHRGTAVATHTVSAHGDLSPADLAALRDPATTTVLMMGLGWLPRLVSQALLNGVDPQVPVAVVQEATMPGQRVVHGTLSTIADVVREAGIGSPAVIAVGRTAAEGFLTPSQRSEPAGGGEPARPTPDPAAGPTLIGCAHGTRDRQGRDVIRSLLRRVQDQLPDVAVREAYVDVQTPEITDAVRAAAPALPERRTRESDAPAAAVVVPLLLSTGFHVAHDIAQAIRDRACVASGPLGPDARLAEVLAQRLLEAGAQEDDTVVLAVAGTRDPDGQAMARQMAQLLSDHLGREVTVGFISAARPSVAEEVARRRESDGQDRRVVLANYLLAPGYFHGLLADAGADVVAAPLGDHPLVADIVVDRYQGMLGT